MKTLRTILMLACTFALTALTATGAFAADTAATPAVDLVDVTAETVPVEMPTAPEALDMQQACIQVITYGKNPGTGECKQYATPCDVPNGFQQFSTLEECQNA